VSDTTKNQGGGAAGASTTRFYLSTNTLLDAGDVFLSDRSVPALAAGASHSAGTAVTIPPGTTGGGYYIIAQADTENAVAETQEGNNLKFVYVQIGPDLIVTALTAPTSAAAGATITVSDTTRNQGGGGADASTTRFYLSTNTLLDASDVPLGDRAVPALAAGATHSASTSITIPAGTLAGSYYLIAKADADNTVAETQEANNLRFAFISITATTSGIMLPGPGPTAGPLPGLWVAADRNWPGGLDPHDPATAGQRKPG
jgi:subtilase family serine protease